MPPLYLYDDYDRCLEEFPVRAIYCLVDSWIVPNETNAIWPVIRHFSADGKRSFRHDRLQRGLCMNRCRQLIGKFDGRTKMKYFLSRFEPSDAQEITFDPNTFRGALDWRNRYRRLANQCVNYELKRQYSLMAYSTVEYCTTNEPHGEEPNPAATAASPAALDAPEVVFLVVLGMLLVLTLASTLYDWIRYRKANTPSSAHNAYAANINRMRDYYRAGLGRPGSSRLTCLLMAFSLPRNWHSLTTARKRITPGAKDLRFIHSVRFLIMYLVIAGHSMLFNCIFPLLNPQYVELNYRRMVTMLIFNGVTVVQTYFTISGFLLAVHFVEFTERQRTFGWRDFFQSITYRFLRLTPVYAFMLLLDASWLIRLQDGPIWKRVAETERTFCRTHWWANVLYLNNYITVSEPCLQQTWYLATDFQLFIFGLALLGLTWRFPRLRKPLFALAITAAILVPAIVTYVNRFEGVVMLRPEALKYVLWYDPMYREMYIPMHTNIGSYLAGLIAGLVYHKLKRAEFVAARHKGFHILWYASLPVAIGLLVSAYIFYAYDFEKPAIWIALYAALSKNLWGALFGVLFVGLAFGVGGFIRGVLNNPIFRPLGKTTYCVFLCHLFVIRVTLGNIRQPIYVSDMRILVSTSSTLVLAYIMGSLMCLLIEIPFSNIQKILFSHKHASEYWQLPPLHAYDSFENCLHNRPHGVFCMTKVVIKPDIRSETWRLIEKYSRYTFQYNHDVLTRGVCVEKCSSLVKRLEDSGVSAERYYVPKFNVSKRYAIADWMLPNATQHRQRYDRLINACQNYALRSDYNLSGFTWIEECKTNDTLTRPYDALDVCFIVLLVTLFVLTVCSQCYDSWLARRSNDEDHFRKPPEGGGVSTLATAFSIRRNWAKLTLKSMRRGSQQDLDLLDTVRVITMSLILLTHVLIGMFMFTAQNQLAMEEFSAHPATQMLFAIVPFQVDQFFCVSGLLMAVQFLQYAEKRVFHVGILWKGILNRYLRSLPVYAVLMLFTVSHYDTFQTTPSAYKILPTVRLICRRKWWINFLFINNYYQPEEQCLIHTWYLAADFQLYVVGLLIMTLLWRYPKATLGTAVSLGVLGFVLPMLNTYFQAVDAMMPLTAKGNEYQLWYDEYFVRAYQATETHCTSYFAGMITGMLYHKIVRSELTPPSSTLRRVYTLTSILSVGFILQAPLYNMINFSKPSAWMAILSGVHKVSSASLLASGLLLLTFRDRKSALRRWFAGNGLSRAMAQLGFAFYLVQMTVLKVVFGNYPEDTRINLQLIVSTFCSTFVLSYAIALFAFLTVEKPFDVIFKLLLGAGGNKDRPLPKTAAKQANTKPDMLSMVMGPSGFKARESAAGNGVPAGVMCHQEGRVTGCSA
uniref:Acyltransferase 3 domain-containing protein n=3 Tax=Anopheles atroparvus TaxID=41427 RepID=A0A182IST2_ANOAO